jgi:CRP-like cAMP-binding protein
MNERHKRKFSHGENRLLASLPKEESNRVVSQCTRVSLAIKDLVYEVDGPISHAYFPETGVISLLIVVGGDKPVEVGTIGNEGMVGLPVFLGTQQSPHRAVTQIPCEALKMKAEAFLEELTRNSPLHGLMHRYTQTILNQTAQLVACNQLHTVEERMCRWLLMAHDRVDSDEFPLTQEFLAEMLVVRRPSVTVNARVLQQAGLIRYNRGRVTVLDREGLEAASCACYEVLRRESDRLFQ